VRLLPTTRVEAFSDGVFAIAITLLVLELKVPTSADRLLDELADEWPSFVAYLVSFAFIGGSWVAHSHLTALLDAADAIFTRLNLLLLLFVSFLPFTTTLLATHLADSGQRVAVLAFGLNLTLAALISGALTSYALHSDGLTDDDNRSELAELGRERWWVVALMTLSTAGGAFLPDIAVLFCLTVSLLLLVDPLRLLRLRHRLSRSTVRPAKRL
jgi:uncharacterized membrane protein